jgi:hypothetical protein
MNFHIRCILFLSLYCAKTFTFEKVNYTFSRDPIDVIIPCHEKDTPALNRAIAHIRQNVKNLRRVIVISAKHLTDNAEWADEKLFPFTKESIIHEIFQNQENAERYLRTNNGRTGWIYQQFLKLFAAYYIPNISSNVLAVDADVVFLKSINFLQEDGAGLYAVGDEYHQTYFDHAARLLPELKKLYPQYSGIVHHMLFQKEVLDDFFNLIQAHHNLEPWIAIARAIPVIDNKISFAPISEYELYFNFAFARTNQVKIRRLNWANASEVWFQHKRGLEAYDYVALHIYNA